MADELSELAEKVRAHAYCPYSGYPVGAALEDSEGRLFSGCNVENVSYGLSICAERSAVFAMVVGGGRHIRRVAVSTKDGGLPCGACLQVLSEFATQSSDVQVLILREGIIEKVWSLFELIPHAFRSPEVKNSN